MNKSIHRPSAKRICRVVEKLVLIWHNGAYNLETAEAILDRIYRFVHLQSECENSHRDWIEEFYKLEKKLEEK